MNTATAAAVGTSPEVLQYYLTAGIDLEWQGWNGKDEFLPCRAKLHALAQQHARVVGHAWALPFKDCLPVLRPFSQLTVPLPTGEVPAELLFEMAFEHNYGQGLPLGVPVPEYAECKFKLVFETAGLLSIKREGFGDCELRMYGDWQMSRIQDGIARWVHHPAALIDKLRAWHFALPVNGRPLVANVDFIPLSAPSTPTREADNNPTL